MCELLGLSFAQPISADFSMREFEKRDGENADGWGLAWYPDRSVAIVKEPMEWGRSKYSCFLETYHHLKSRIYIGHVRHKTTGGTPTHADTHPFGRELGGRDYCLAHNGTLTGPFWELPLKRYRPVGNTDSEYLFCHMLEEISQVEGHLRKPESWPWLHAQLVAWNRWGKINCLMSDGQRLFCYHDKNGWKGLTLRKVYVPNNESRSFGDPELRVDMESTPGNHGFVVATRPLTPTGWLDFHAGELMVLGGGVLQYSSHLQATDREKSLANR